MSDTDDYSAADLSLTYDDLARPSLPIRVSVGPNGRPLVEFPVPRGPLPEALLGTNSDPEALGRALWKAGVELRDGLRACRDLLRAMRLEDRLEAGAGVGAEEREGEMK